jgi:hypothetical protein
MAIHMVAKILAVTAYGGWHCRQQDRAGERGAAALEKAYG